MAQIKIENIIKQFGDVLAVNNFSVDIKDGEFVSILGPSGCGKTTMLRMIAGFERATKGTISIGENIVSSSENKTFVPPEKRGIGMVFQSYAVWPHMSVFDNVAYPLKIKKKNKDEIKRRVEEVLEMVHLTPYIERFPHQLSGGQQQRVALGRALVAEPELLLLDEPLSNLDAKLRESMRFEIKALQEKTGVTVVYVTHDQAEAMAMSDRIVVMHGGIIQQIDRPVCIYENPANQIVADFIGLVNFIDGIVEENDVINMPKINCKINYKTELSGDVVVAVRPENISISKTQESSSHIKGVLKHKVYLGDSVDYRVFIGDKEIRVINKADQFEDFAEDSDVYIYFEKILLFNK